MGRYMRKGKVGGEVAVVMDLAPHSSLGVRTRAKTLALRRLLLQDSAAGCASFSSSPSAASYLQLRSRRLEKEKPPPASPSSSSSSKKVKDGISCKGVEDGGDESSFGDNITAVEFRNRDTRETTPCSMILRSDSIGTPGSTTRHRNLNVANGRMHNAAACRSFPTTQELEEFFAGAEQIQQRMFLEKYNYDCVNDCPLPGRFEWVKLNS